MFWTEYINIYINQYYTQRINHGNIHLILNIEISDINNNWKVKI